MNQTAAPSGISPVTRARAWYTLLLVVFGLFAIRLFYLQVIRYDYYKKAAQSDQLKEYTVPAARGTITAHLGDQMVPLVLNQKLYTLYADPTLLKNSQAAAEKLQPVIGGSVADLANKLRTPRTRYVILKKKLTPAQNTKVLSFKLPGVGTQEQDYRTYPQGSMASQLLGFVNDEEQGKYGVEQALNTKLSGRQGLLKAVTDINGIPLAANASNLSKPPEAGSNVGLTIDMGMQTQLEKILKAAAEKDLSKNVSAVVMDVHTGAVKAMANYPTYDPANYQHVTDAALFQNQAVSMPIEPGSITKLFTTAAGLQLGAITPNSSFYDPGRWLVDGSYITDVAQDHSTGQQNIETTLNLSLNTGAAWMLMQMGGGQINQKARSALYDYFTNHFRLGSATGIEQGYEALGYVPKPKDTGSGINLTYGNMAFGQAYSATALQMVAGLSSIVNGGTYYQPYLVDQLTNVNGSIEKTAPKVVGRNVVSKQVSSEVVNLMEKVNTDHVDEGFSYLKFGDKYGVGGKTGTAEIANPTGGYYTDRVNGSFLGFVGGDTPQYAIVVYNMLPTKYSGFAGANTGQPVFADIAHTLINDFGVTPRKP